MAVVLALPGLALIAAKLVLAALHDPNAADVETRKRIGRARTLRREALRRMEG